MKNFLTTKNFKICFFILCCFLSVSAQSFGEEKEVIDNETCFTCHSDPEATPFVDPEKFKSSIHGGNLCISCHSDIVEVPHEEKLKPVSCGSCHRIETELYLNSDHGKALGHGVTEAATCQSCHGNPHELLNSRNLVSPVYRENIPKTCAHCHEKTEEMKKFNLNIAEPVSSYEHSVHGMAVEGSHLIQAAVCTDCHGSHALSKATNEDSKLFWKNIPTTCGKCHENVQMTYMRSIHGQAVREGKREAPVCTDCHGEHSIEEVKKITSKVAPAHITETCGQCHAVERITTKYSLPNNVVDTFMQSYHGLAIKLGSVITANCASCHGFHDILPVSDSNSSVNPKNLEQTCGKCHAGVSEQVAKGKIHTSRKSGLENKAGFFVSRFYIILIIAVIGFLFLHNCLDFIKKLRAHYQRMSSLGKPKRMSTNERIQHLILLTAFIALAYTGFALKYPQAWWASPFVGRVDWRSLGHRAAALIFCVLSLYHVVYVLFTQKGRHHLNALILRKKDFIQCGQMFAYYFGWRKERPIFGFYGYVEKFEYWALVWGSMIMVLTGGLMLWENWFLHYFPKWLYDVIAAIHYYEAVLACLAILIWHGYFVMFDPDVYPMKWTWVTGDGSKEDEHRTKEH
ncbi:MAG: cytochrome b/b6 domain-containing protein [Candidatus Omnitrophota bacterium]